MSGWASRALALRARGFEPLEVAARTVERPSEARARDEQDRLPPGSNPVVAACREHDVGERVLEQRDVGDADRRGRRQHVGRGERRVFLVDLLGRWYRLYQGIGRAGGYLAYCREVILGFGVTEVSHDKHRPLWIKRQR